ncbi:hydrolase [Desulfitobacterium metallireducens DSM 15288]|uniref:Hydrolase n=1 Tax=Desulfitobacterium metallireducens DSM 15288 TaxID=871968 RepID=W0E7F0_9FIRM|nr:hydrolase [Desulfitobacterium metallireducens DSM 15288]
MIGAALSTFSGHPIQITDPVFLGCTLGAMLPDLDIVTYFKGRLNYLMKHRGASHSLLALSGMALGLGSLIYAMYPTTSWGTIVFWTLIGTLSHGLSDLLNSYGAELFWPFFRKKLTVDMIIVTDPVVLGFFILSLVISILHPTMAMHSSLTAFLLSIGYLFYRESYRIKTRDKLMQRYKITDKTRIKVLPAMYKPFNWSFLLFEETEVRFGIVLGEKARILKNLPRCDHSDPSIANAMEGGLAEIFTQFTPYYHVLLKEEDDQLKVEFLDLRYWDREDFLYTGEVLMLPDGQIAEETFYSFKSRNSAGIVLEY